MYCRCRTNVDRVQGREGLAGDDTTRAGSSAGVVRALDLAAGLRLRAVSLRSECNGRYAAHTGPSRGDPCKPAIRPSETIAIRAATDALDPTRALEIGPMNGR